MNNENQIRRHTIIASVENQPGVLARVIGLISGRGYNIESLNVGPTQDPSVSRITMVVPGGDRVLELVTNQLHKMVDVIEVTDLSRETGLDQEGALSQKARLIDGIEESARTVGALVDQVPALQAICSLVVASLKSGNKILTAGNGGSAAEAMHMAEEFLGRFRNNRRSLPALALVADGTTLTCISNDFGYDQVFSRQIEGLGKPGDILVLFSTSGSAANLRLALEAARAHGMKVIGLLGKDGGPLAGKCDLEIIVKGTATERIQEAHQVLLHLILDAVEREFA